MTTPFEKLRKRIDKREFDRTLLPVTPIQAPLTDAEENMVNELDDYFLGVAEKHGIDLGDPDLGEWDGPCD
jgi:hypothetical protein